LDDRRFSDQLGEFAELLRLGEALQLLQRLVLDLADPLAGDVEGTRVLRDLKLGVSG
jgi:hypothetical protein